MAPRSCTWGTRLARDLADEGLRRNAIRELHRDPPQLRVAIVSRPGLRRDIDSAADLTALAHTGDVVMHPLH